MTRPFLYCVLLLMTGCHPMIRLRTPPRAEHAAGGTAVYKGAFPMGWKQRDSVVQQEILAGNLPSFLKKMVPVRVSVKDPASGRLIHATYYVTPDYLSAGSDQDWVRVNITPMAAQRIADSFHCFLPTRKMVDDIYRAAKVKLEPVPMYAFRDSTPTMYQHHLIIEGQRKGRTGLIAGIKKDVVISGALTHNPKTDRLAIYGWHMPDGKPIQPLYTGHVNWWVDYSQGIRLVYRMIRVDGKWMDYRDVLADPKLKLLLCDEAYCDCYGYAY